MFNVAIINNIIGIEDKAYVEAGASFFGGLPQRVEVFPYRFAHTPFGEVSVNCMAKVLFGGGDEYPYILAKVLLCVFAIDNINTLCSEPFPFPEKVVYFSFVFQHRGAT